MRKELPTYQLIIITVFLGILLSFSVFYLTNMFVNTDAAIADVCYDGRVIEGEDFISSFDRAVYQSATSLERVHEYQYDFFGIVNSAEVVAGKDNFLFEIYDEENDYYYLEDFTGNATFTEEQAAAILAELTRRRDLYESRGAEYLLVVIPNAQTVYSECMPHYYGPIGENTRLEALDDYLQTRGYYNLVNLTEDLREAKKDGQLYNNTENSLNSLGMYYTYRAVYQRFSADVRASADVIERERLSFYQHMMSGKSVARRAGVADVVENRTVSLSNGTRLNYRYLANTGRTSTTILLPFYVSSAVSGSPELLLQFSNTWERLQIEPFFSNTFGKVTYQTDLTDDLTVYGEANPRVVIQFIYENQLSLLLPE